MPEDKTPPGFIPYASYRELPTDAMLEHSRTFTAELQRRRTVREFSDRPIPREVIENCLLAAGTAPSGAHQQPWHFAVVSDPATQRAIRDAAEAEERRFYATAPTEWLAALQPLGTDAVKPYLEIAPCLIVVFAQRSGIDAAGKPIKHYYVAESVGIACGLLLAALHHSGLASLTHTPSPMRFLNGILGRPEHEHATLVIVVGYPAPGARVPDLHRKPLAQIASFHGDSRLA